MVMLHIAVDLDHNRERLRAWRGGSRGVLSSRTASPAISFMQISAGGAEADDAGDVERASNVRRRSWPPPLILLGDLDARVAAANVKRADTLGSVDFVTAEREHVDVHGLHVDGDLGLAGLDGVGVEEDALLLVADPADFGDGLDNADFVVREHDGDEDGLVGAFGDDGALEVLEINEAVCLGRGDK